MNDVSERGYRGESLTKNLDILRKNRNRKEKVSMSKLSDLSRKRDCYVCIDLLCRTINGYCPSENVLDRIEPLVKELIEARGLPFDDWRIGFKL